jgi:ABC-2 type transport system permease protein
MKFKLDKTFLLFVGIIVAVNVIFSFTNWSLDLTQDKRFTLTESTKSLIKNVDDIVNVKIYLKGDFPPGIESLEEKSNEMLVQFKKMNNKLVISAENIDEGSLEERQNRYDALVKEGLVPTSLKVFDGKEYRQKVIFPYVVFQIGQRKVFVNLLEPQNPGQDEQEVLQQSISLLEYKFVNAIQKLQLTRKRNIVFTSGNGEAVLQNTVSLERDLRKWYNTGRVNLDSIVKLDDEVDLVIVAGPKSKFSDQSKFKLDQYIMNGGKVIWMLEKLTSSLDSINKYQFYIPQDIETGLDDLLFKYGAKVMPNLVLDLESTNIPQIVGQSGDKPQTMLFKWPYHPLIAAKIDHPIVKNIDRVNLFFPSQVDTSLTEMPVKKTVLLSTSPYSRTQFSPVRLNFEILKQQPDPSLYNKGNIPLALLLEGLFTSAYKNRLTSDFRETLKTMNLSFKEQSIPTKQLVIGDVHFALNLINSRTDQPEEVGFNKWEIQQYKGNKDFILNAIEYMIDDNHILDSRSKEIKLRPLDKVKVENEKTKWQLINLLAPILLIVLAYFTITYLRKKKYSL